MYSQGRCQEEKDDREKEENQSGKEKENNRNNENGADETIFFVANNSFKNENVSNLF